MSFEQVVGYRLFSIGDTPVTVATLTIAVVIAIASVIVSRLSERGMVRFLGHRGVACEGTAAATARLLQYLLLGVGLAVALSTLGINLTALFTAGAFLAIALGFAMQNITQNFVAGLILLVERSIKPNDIIEVEGRLVRITSLGLRATTVRTWDSEDYIIPNSILVSTTVKNLTLRDRLYRIRTHVGVTYGSDMKKVREVLEDVARDVPWRDQSQDPRILMSEFGNSSVNWDVSVWVVGPFARAVKRSLLNEAIWSAFKDAGIIIAFPQLDLHLDEPALDAISGRERAGR